MAKSISRLTCTEAMRLGHKMNSRLPKTTRGILAGSRYAGYSMEEKGLIQKAVEAYRSFADKLYIYEGQWSVSINDIKERVLTHAKVIGTAPVVIIDYLQILSPFDIRLSDKQNMDKAIEALYHLARDLKTPVIVISSLNRESYKNSNAKGEITQAAYKESGIIEYGADVLLALEYQTAGSTNFNLKDEMRKAPRQLKFKVLKQRNGEVFGEVNLDYYSMFNYFTETGVKA